MLTLTVQIPLSGESLDKAFRELLSTTGTINTGKLIKMISIGKRTIVKSVGAVRNDTGKDNTEEIVEVNATLLISKALGEKKHGKH